MSTPHDDSPSHAELEQMAADLRQELASMAANFFIKQSDEWLDNRKAVLVIEDIPEIH